MNAQDAGKTAGEENVAVVKRVTVHVLPKERQRLKSKTSCEIRGQASSKDDVQVQSAERVRCVQR